MKRIAVFLPNWIGDAVMATPAIAALAKHYPAAELINVCTPYVADTLSASPWFQHRVLLQKRTPLHHWIPKATQELRVLKPDAAVLLPNSFTPALIARLAGARTVVGFARYYRDGLLTHRLYPHRSATSKPKPSPVLLDYNRLVRLLGVPDPGHTMQLHVTAESRERADALLNRFPPGGRLIGLNPGGAFGSSKHWADDRFAELAHRCAANGQRVLVLCGPKERDTARRIVQFAAHPHVMSLADDDVSIDLTKAVISKLQGFVTTDSGPRHIAAAFGVPVVALFGPTHQEWTSTFFDLETRLQKRVPCGPCQLRTCPVNHRCMTELSAAEVHSALTQVLARRQARQPVRQERRHAG